MARAKEKTAMVDHWIVDVIPMQTPRETAQPAASHGAAVTGYLRYAERPMPWSRKALATAPAIFTAPAASKCVWSLQKN